MPAAWIIYHEGGQVRTMHASTVDQAKDIAEHNTTSNKWAWAHVAAELCRYDSPDYLKLTKRETA